MFVYDDLNELREDIFIKFFALKDEQFADNLINDGRVIF